MRYSEALKSAESWNSIVLFGAREDDGMASFAQVLDKDSADAIRAFVISQANAAAK